MALIPALKNSDWGPAPAFTEPSSILASRWKCTTPTPEPSDLEKKLWRCTKGFHQQQSCIIFKPKPNTIEVPLSTSKLVPVTWKLNKRYRKHSRERKQKDNLNTATKRATINNGRSDWRLDSVHCHSNYEQPWAGHSTTNYGNFGTNMLCMVVLRCHTCNTC